MNDFEKKSLQEMTDMALENAKLQMQDYMYSEVLLALRKIQSCV